FARAAVASAVRVGGWAPLSPSPPGGRDGDGDGDGDGEDDAVLGGRDAGVGGAVLPEAEEKEKGPMDNFGGERGTQHDDDDDDGDEIARMLAVAGRAAADVESVGRALVVVEEKVVNMQAEVDEAVRETD
ncbi:unnamed protein product, partial [Ectocarpus sp. 12 AP-2014]